VTVAELIADLRRLDPEAEVWEVDARHELHPKTSAPDLEHINFRPSQRFINYGFKPEEIETGEWRVTAKGVLVDGDTQTKRVVLL